MSNSGRISAQLGIDRKNRLKNVADKAYQGSITAALIAAVDALTQAEEAATSGLPSTLKNKVEFLHLITQSGSMNDWELVKTEVQYLWQSVQ